MEGRKDRRVDGHLHLFEAVSEEYPRDVHPLFPAGLSAPVERFIGVMDQQGIDHAVVVPLSAHDHYLRHCLSSYPGRFKGIGIHSFDVTDMVEDLHRRMKDVGISGLRVFDLRSPDETGVDDVSRLRIYPLLREMEKTGSILWYYWSEEQVEIFAQVPEHFPGLRIAMNHLGFVQGGFEVDPWGRPKVKTKVPSPALPTLLKYGARYPEIYVMFSGEYAFSNDEFPFPDCKATVEQLYSVFGAERMFWASDYPWIIEKPGYGEQLELVDYYLPGISAEARGMIMGGTAATLFGFV